MAESFSRLDRTMYAMASLQILLFDVHGNRCAIRREAVQEVLPLPHLWRPPSLPRPIAGFFNLGGVAVPVVNLAALFGLLDSNPRGGVDANLYHHMMLVNGPTEERTTALLVDRVVDLAQSDVRSLSPVGPEGTLNGCVEAEIDITGQLVHLLSLDRIFLLEEQQALETLGRQAQERLSEWAVTT